MLLDIAAIIAGLAILVWSADLLIAGAATIARELDISPLVIGITVIGFGTSAPEIMVATIASLEGNPGLAIGNAIGSNITNITLVLGIAALIAPLSVHSRIIKRELPLLFVSMLLITFLLLDNVLDMTDGIILCSSLILLMWWLTREALRARGRDVLQDEIEQEMPDQMPLKKAVALLIISLIMLVASSELLVYGAVNIAVAFGISNLIIGLTIVAIGTSLPEVAAAVAGARRNEHDLAIGNVVGSNLFNGLMVLGIPGILSPTALEPGVIERDIPYLFVLTVTLIIMAFGIKGEGKINRSEGFLLFSAFIGYQSLLYYTVTHT